MKIEKIEVSFTKEELQRAKQRKDMDNNEDFLCGGIDCAKGLSCEACPLGLLTRKEALKYIKNHLEE